MRTGCLMAALKPSGRSWGAFRTHLLEKTTTVLCPVVPVNSHDNILSGSPGEKALPAFHCGPPPIPFGTVGAASVLWTACAGLFRAGWEQGWFVFPGFFPLTSFCGPLKILDLGQLLEMYWR